MRKNYFGELQKIVTPVTWCTFPNHKDAKEYILSNSVISLSKCGEINNIRKFPANGRVTVRCNLIKYVHKRPSVEKLIFFVSRVVYYNDSDPISELRKFENFSLVRSDHGWRVTLPENMYAYFVGILKRHRDWIYKYDQV